VRRAWHEFVAYKGNNPYSMTDAIVFMSRCVPHTRAGSSNDAYGPLGPELARFLRELRP
jgi:hypothetical protein